MAGCGSKKSGIVDSIKIVPYLKKDGVPTFLDSEIFFLWEKAVSEKAMDYMFLDRKTVSPQFFLEYIQGFDINFFVVFADKEMVAFILMTNILYGKAELHFFSYNNCQREKALEVSRYCLKYLINIKLTESTYLYDVIIGITPVKNVFACILSKKAGMKVVGRIPKYLYNIKTKQQEDVMYQYYSRGLL